MTVSLSLFEIAWTPRQMTPGFPSQLCPQSLRALGVTVHYLAAPERAKTRSRDNKDGGRRPNLPRKCTGPRDNHATVSRRHARAVSRRRFTITIRPPCPSAWLGCAELLSLAQNGDQRSHPRAADPFPLLPLVAPRCPLSPLVTTKAR